MKKRVTFESLKPGQKFRYKRKLYIKDQLRCGVCLSDGTIPSTKNFPDNTLVTPVKVRITLV